MGKITLYHNTSNDIAVKISKEGIKGGMRLQAYGKGSEAEGAGIWCTTVRGYGYGGATITFEVDENDEDLIAQNDDEYIIYRDVAPEEIIDIDLVVSTIPSNRNRRDATTTLESDIPDAVKIFGKDRIISVFGSHSNSFVEPYNLEQLKQLMETGNKYCKGKIKLDESKYNFLAYTFINHVKVPIDGADTREELEDRYEYSDEVFVDENDDIPNANYSKQQKLEEASRNELLAKAKAETITRYNKSAGYKGFSLVDIDTTAIKTRDSIVITNRVGNYFDTIELEDILYWVGLEVDETPDKKMNLETVRRALLGAMDGMDIKVDCNCGDFCLEENTLIKLLNGEVKPVKEIKKDFELGKELWVYSTDDKGDFKPGKVKNVWISGKRQDMIKVILDNGKEIITTPEHRYMMRDGSYKQAKDLKSDDSLMPLYFSYTNGYENVKRNSIAHPTRFDSVYKIVADTVLGKEKEEAKERSHEDIIQIHHKDFNKLNNYPSNLNPMGKMEHWMYHAELGKEHIDKLIESGKEFWKSDPRRFEALEKQKRRASESKKEWWASMTEDEKKEWVAKHNWAAQDSSKQIMSDNAKKVWDSYTDEEKQKRLENNVFINNNPMQSQEYRNSQSFTERNLAISDGLKKFHKNTTPEERSNLYGWAKGKTFTEEHRNKIKSALKEKADIIKRKGLITRCRNTFNRMIDDGAEITEDNFNKYKDKFDPSYKKIYSSFEEMLKELDIKTNYNHKVASVEAIKYKQPIDVYDLEVEDYHNFYLDAGVMVHNCYRFAYMATVLEYKYDKPENRPSNITNPNAYGALCKHLISLLSNKSWVKQVASTLQQWIIDEIDWVRKYLNVKEEDFKLPDEYARQLGRHGAMKKFWDKQPDTDNKDNTENEDTENDNVDNNEPDNKDDGADSSEVAPETNNNEETTNNTPDEKSTLNNQTNMPKTFRGNSDEELEEK